MLSKADNLDLHVLQAPAILSKSQRRRARKSAAAAATSAAKAKEAADIEEHGSWFTVQPKQPPLRKTSSQAIAFLKILATLPATTGTLHSATHSLTSSDLKNTTQQGRKRASPKPTPFGGNRKHSSIHRHIKNGSPASQDAAKQTNSKTQPSQNNVWNSMPKTSQTSAHSSADASAAGSAGSSIVLPANDWPTLSRAAAHVGSTPPPAQSASAATGVQAADTAPMDTAVAALADGSQHQTVAVVHQPEALPLAAPHSQTEPEPFAFGSMPNVQGEDDHQLHAALQAPAVPFEWPPIDELLSSEWPHNDKMHFLFGSFPHLQGVEENAFVCQAGFLRAAVAGPIEDQH